MIMMMTLIFLFVDDDDDDHHLYFQYKTMVKSRFSFICESEL